ncbi:hypothetical protein G9P44_005775 [Scheffersomyces stipitis]|nr:hypothetical protein G9P44_005775 [Scheffersomyces stipitis]
MSIVKSLEDLPSLNSDTSSYSFDTPVRVLRIYSPQDAIESNYYHIYVTDYSAIGPPTWMADEVERVKSPHIADTSISREWKFLIVASRTQLQTLIEEKFKKTPKDVVLKQLPVLAQARFVVKRHVNGIYGSLISLDFNTAGIIAGLELREDKGYYYAYARLFARFKILATQNQIYLAEQVYNFTAKFGKLLDEILEPTKQRKKGRQHKLPANTSEQNAVMKQKDKEKQKDNSDANHKGHSIANRDTTIQIKVSVENDYTKSTKKTVNINSNSNETNDTTNTDINNAAAVNTINDTVINDSNSAVSGDSVDKEQTSEAPDSQDIRQVSDKFKVDAEPSVLDKAADVRMGTYRGETQPQTPIVGNKFSTSSPRSEQLEHSSPLRTKESSENSIIRAQQQIPSASASSDDHSPIALRAESLSSSIQEQRNVNSSKDKFSKQEDHSLTSVKRLASLSSSPSKKQRKTESLARTEWAPGGHSISNLDNTKFKKSPPTGADLLFHNQDDEDSQAPLFPPTQATAPNYLTFEAMLNKQSQIEIVEEENDSTAYHSLPPETKSTQYDTSSSNMPPPPSSRVILPNSSQPPLAQGSLPVPQTPKALQGVKRQSSSVPNHPDNVHSQISENATVVSPTLMPSQRAEIEIDIDISPPPTQPRLEDSTGSAVSSRESQDKDSIGIIGKAPRTYISKTMSIAQLLKVPLTVEEISKKQIYEVRGAFIKGLQPFRPFIVKPFKRTIKVANFNIVLTDRSRDLVVEFHNEIEICHFLGVDEVEEVYNHLSTIEDDIIKLAKLEHPTTNNIRLVRKTKTARDNMLYPYWACLSTLEDLIA